jgi:hypothetical protein
MGTAVSARQGVIEAGVMPSERLVCTTSRAGVSPRDDRARLETLLHVRGDGVKVCYGGNVHSRRGPSQRPARRADRVIRRARPV